MPGSGPFRLLYAQPEKRNHKLLPSGRALPMVDYGPAVIWPEKAEPKKNRYVVFRVPGKFPGETEDLRFVVVAETTAGKGPVIHHAMCTACFHENNLREIRDLKKGEIGRIFVRAGRLVNSDPRIPEGKEHLCKLIVDDMRLKDTTPKPSRWRNISLPAYPGATSRTWGRAMTKAVQGRLRKAHVRREPRQFERVIYPKTPAPKMSSLKIEPEANCENDDDVQLWEGLPEPPFPKGRRILFQTTHF